MLCGVLKPDLKINIIFDEAYIGMAQVILKHPIVKLL